MSATVPVSPNFGSLYGPGPHYVTPEGTAVWMWRKGQRVRFCDVDGCQVGPEHRNVVPAVVWAAAQAWVDPRSPGVSLAVIAEVRGQIGQVSG